MTHKALNVLFVFCDEHLRGIVLGFLYSLFCNIPGVAGIIALAK